MSLRLMEEPLEPDAYVVLAEAIIERAVWDIRCPEDYGADTEDAIEFIRGVWAGELAAFCGISDGAWDDAVASLSRSAISMCHRRDGYDAADRVEYQLSAEGAVR